MSDSLLLPPLSRPLRGGASGRTPQQAAAENMRQLIQLRWIAVLGQLVAILFTHFVLGVRLPLPAMLAVVAVLVAANLLFTLSLRRGWRVRGELFVALLIDMAALTTQLYLSGGVENPFTALYLVQIVLGAILLPPLGAWLLVGVAVLAFALLSLAHLPLNLADAGADAAALRVLGEETAFIMVAVLLVLFMTRIGGNIRARDDYLAELRHRAAEEDGIVRMGLFASGAAHELGTPLSTLSVLIADWQRDPALAAHPGFQDELAEAQAEVRRCKAIVSNILHSAGTTRGEAMRAEAVADLLEGLARDWATIHAAIPLRRSWQGLGSARIAADPALRQAVWSLLENAGDASPSGVELAASVEGDWVTITVLDRGPGFPPEHLAQIGRLYQSSKGEGHGLGLFLAANVARRLGGSLAAENRDGRGAAVRLLLPLISSADLGELSGARHQTPPDPGG